VFDCLKSRRNGLLDSAKKELRERIRKDTEVTLHLRGANGEIKTFDQIFGRNSSFLNRLLTYLLYRSGAFALEFSELEKQLHDMTCRLCMSCADMAPEPLTSLASSSPILHLLNLS
jgi:hypothetical protein